MSTNTGRDQEVEETNYITRAEFDEYQLRQTAWTLTMWQQHKVAVREAVREGVKEFLDQAGDREGQMIDKMLEKVNQRFSEGIKEIQKANKLIAASQEKKWWEFWR
ncbi:DUF3967 domain-containing protein [Ectobacillus panaciterrae]|uniref:DUF3967 domain-containing protein n=1 Tax=Ectobacillus panaciterrae TaxID=363872 RepID=UPI00040628B9|nr:DUF3967 domain-containing protein [Ectobacillus panaciterrae]